MKTKRSIFLNSLFALALLALLPIQAMADIGVIGALTKRLSSEDRYTRINAALSLAMIGPEAEQAVEELVNALDDPDVWVRVAVVEALVVVAPSNKALPGLKKALKDERKIVKAHAVSGLKKIPTKEAEELLKGLKAE